MGFIITDNKDESKEISTNAWNWGPTVELLKKMDILDEERLELIRFNCGTEVTTEEAHKIGTFIREKILSRLEQNERVMLDMTVTDEPDDGTFHRDDLGKNYSASYDWLKKFSDFCMESSGFTVY